MSETKDLLRLLFRRDDVVARLRDGPLDIRSLTSAVNVSRPTVHRSLKSLEDHDVVVETRDGYALTSYGEILFDRYRTTMDGFEDVTGNKELLLALRDSSAISQAMLDGASYTRSVPFAPEKPIREIERLVRDGTRVRGFSPVVVSRYVALFHEQLLQGSFEAEIILTADVFDYLASNWGAQLEETVDAGLTCLVAERDLPFGLVLVEEPDPRVCVVVYDDGTLCGVIQNDTAAAVNWARDLYTTCHADATQPTISSD